MKMKQWPAYRYIPIWVCTYTDNIKIRRRKFMVSWGITSESQVRAQAAYDREHTVRLSLKLNVRTDKDIIQWIRSQKSMQGTIKRLVREEIARTESQGQPDKPK